MQQCAHEAVDDTGACTWCGLVLYPLQTRDIEWRTYGEHDVRARGDTTGLRCENNESSSSYSYIYGTREMVRQHMRLRGKNIDSVLNVYCNELETICEYLCISRSISDHAAALLKYVAKDNGLWRGAKRNAVMAACISIVCQMESVGITDREISTCILVQCKPAYVNKQKKLIMQLLHDRNMPLPMNPDAAQFSVRMCAQLGYSTELSEKVRIAAAALQAAPHMQSKHCTSIVAVSILVAVSYMNARVDILELAHYCNVTEWTLMKWMADAGNKQVRDVKPLIVKLHTGSGIASNAREQ